CRFHWRRTRFTFSRATPAIAARSACKILCPIMMRPLAAFLPRCFARWSRTRATRALTVRKLLAANASSASRNRAASTFRRYRLKFGMQHAFFEMGSADKAQFAVLNRDDRCRSRATVDEGKLAHDRPRADDRQRQCLPTL